MIISKESGCLLIGKALKDAEIKASSNGNHYARISFKVDTRPAAEGGGKYDGPVVSVTVWGNSVDSAAHIQKFDRLQIMTHAVEKKPRDDGGFYYNAIAEAIFPSLDVVARMVQTYANTAPEPVVSTPPASAVFDPSLSALLDESDDLPF